MKLDDLQEQLTRLGQQPVPAPRSEFAEALLARIQHDHQHSGVVAPVISLTSAHRRNQRMRRVALGALAAASLAAVGVISLNQGDEGTAQVRFEAAASSDRAPAANGKLDLSNADDGHLNVHCDAGGRFVVTFASGPKPYECRAGENIPMQLRGGNLVEPSASTTAVAATKFILRETSLGSRISFEWDAVSNPAVAKFVVKRTIGDAVPTFADTTVALVPAGGPLQWSESADLLPVNTSAVTYKVIGLDASGGAVIQSRPLRIGLVWTGSQAESR